jgi:hypothetical protein
MSHDLNFWGSVASLAGLAITLVGFGVTLYKVKQVRLAAETARKELRETLDRVAARLLLSHVAAAVRLAQELRTLAREQRWHRAIDRGEQLQVLLASLVDDSGLTAQDRQFLSTAIDDVSLVIASCDENRQAAAEEDAELPGQTVAALNTLVIRLSRLDGRLRAVTAEFEDA